MSNLNQDYSAQAVLQFLDFLGRKGLVNRNTVASRKAAVNTFFGILSADEAQDIRNIDLDEISRRFVNLKGDGFKPESVRVYRSRVANTLEDFKNFKEEPLKFRPSVGTRRANVSRVKDTPAQPVQADPSMSQRIGRLDSAFVEFPVPIRPGVVVTLAGIPSDMTHREAAKIANVVMALAQDDETELNSGVGRPLGPEGAPKGGSSSR